MNPFDGQHPASVPNWTGGLYAAVLIMGPEGKVQWMLRDAQIEVSRADMFYGLGSIPDHRLSITVGGLVLPTHPSPG